MLHVPGCIYNIWFNSSTPVPTSAILQKFLTCRKKAIQRSCWCLMMASGLSLSALLELLVWEGCFDWWYQSIFPSQLLNGIVNDHKQIGIFFSVAYHDSSYDAWCIVFLLVNPAWQIRKRQFEISHHHPYWKNSLTCCLRFWTDDWHF